AEVTSEGGMVGGNVLVYPNATYDASGTAIGGNVQAARATKVQLVTTAVNGNVQSEECSDVTMPTGTVAGDIKPGDRGSVDIDGVFVDGNVQVYDNTGGVAILNNEIGGNLQCEGNVPAPTGGNNVVHGSAEDQCEGLAVP